MARTAAHILIACLAVCLTPSLGLGSPFDFTVNTLGDLPDALPGDGLAEDINGDTSLRAAIDESNALYGSNTITFDHSLAGQVITADGQVGDTEYVITDDVDILGVLTGTNDMITITNSDDSPRLFHVLPGVSVGLYDLIFSECFSSFDGAFCFNQGVLYMGQCIVEDCWSAGNGGAIATDHVNGSLWVACSAFLGNAAAFHGGAIYTDSDFYLPECWLIDNASGGHGGALYIAEDVDTYSALPPGAVSHLHACLLQDNVSESGEGGGAFVECRAALSLHRTDFIGNEANMTGGAIMNLGTLVLEEDHLAKDRGLPPQHHSQITLNAVTSPSGMGGGIFNAGSLVIEDYTGPPNPPWVVTPSWSVIGNIPNDIVYIPSPCL